MKIHLKSRYIKHKARCGLDIMDFKNLILSDNIKEVNCLNCIKILKRDYKK